jgi:hypothetical protein
MLHSSGYIAAILTDTVGLKDEYNLDEGISIQGTRCECRGNAESE